jgi:hypothetical protein
MQEDLTFISSFWLISWTSAGFSRFWKVARVIYKCTIAYLLPHPSPWLALDLSKPAALSIYTTMSLPYAIHVLWRWRRHMFPKRRHFIFTRRGSTQKKIIFDSFRLFASSYKTALIHERRYVYGTCAERAARLMVYEMSTRCLTVSSDQDLTSSSNNIKNTLLKER